MILADTSVWIEHLQSGDEQLTAFLSGGEVLGHPFVMGELALGNLRRREALLSDFQDLPQAIVASDEEVLNLINRQTLFGRGLGYVDAHLLAAVLLTAGSRLWTRDRRLQAVAAELGLAAGYPIDGIEKPARCVTLCVKDYTWRQICRLIPSCLSGL